MNEEKILNELANELGPVTPAATPKPAKPTKPVPTTNKFPGRRVGGASR